MICGRITVAAPELNRSDITASHVEKAVELARRVVKAPGARPAIRSTKDCARPICRINTLQFRRDEIERAWPGQGV
jgi:hypothetical protein